MKRPVRDIPELDAYYLLQLEKYADSIESKLMIYDQYLTYTNANMPDLSIVFRDLEFRLFCLNRDLAKAERTK